MSVALNKIPIHQTTGTEALKKAITNFLNYCATHPEAILEYKDSNTILYIHSDDYYLSISEGQSCAGGFFS